MKKLLLLLLVSATVLCVPAFASGHPHSGRHHGTSHHAINHHHHHHNHNA